MHKQYAKRDKKYLIKKPSGKRAFAVVPDSYFEQRADVACLYLLIIVTNTQHSVTIKKTNAVVSTCTTMLDFLG